MSVSSAPTARAVHGFAHQRNAVPTGLLIHAYDGWRGRMVWAHWNTDPRSVRGLELSLGVVPGSFLPGAEYVGSDRAGRPFIVEWEG